MSEPARTETIPERPRRQPDVRVGSATNALTPISSAERSHRARPSHWFALALVAAAALVADQITKHVVANALRPDDSVQLIGPFSIECRRTIHHIPTTALRIRAGGRSLGYSADTAFDPSLVVWLAEADLFVHETNYGVHTPYFKLADLPAELRRKMRLIHYPDGFEQSMSTIELLR